MRTIIKLLSVVFLITLFSCSGDDDGNSTSGDLIIGKWKQISETENGTPQELTSCDLLEMTEFKTNGEFIAEDRDLVNGECVLDDPSEPGITIDSKWEKLGSNSYRVNLYANGQLALTFDFTTEFSNNNNTVTTTATEPSGDVVVSVMNRI